ncbi:MAG: SIS domain-containing protein, partial [bacterium]|nr:SIS domain-containing protein [bacterium]
MQSRDILRSALDDAASTLKAFVADEENLRAVVKFAETASETLDRGGRIYACGNGGSMSDAMHFAEEWTGRFRGNRDALPALAFSDASQLTCIANDFG